MDWEEKARKHAESFIDGDFVNDPVYGRIGMSKLQIQHVVFEGSTHSVKRYVGASNRDNRNISLMIEVGQWYYTRSNITGEGATPSAAVNNFLVKAKSESKRLDLLAKSVERKDEAHQTCCN